MNSCIYEGTVRHRRFAPAEHAFSYALFMMYLDLDELPTLFDGRWFWSTRRVAPARFRREDYLGDPRTPLDVSVRDTVEASLGRRPAGPIRLLTHLRYYGYCFNPVSFYYCYQPDGVTLDAIIAHITNTPWNEKHAYVLDARPREGKHTSEHHLDKRFHISPFMGMDQRYTWHLNPPDQALSVHMKNEEAGRDVFDATLTLRRREITGANLARALLMYPPMTLKVVAGIYYQALRLWLKKCPFHSHPKWSSKAMTS